MIFSEAAVVDMLPLESARGTWEAIVRAVLVQED